MMTPSPRHKLRALVGYGDFDAFHLQQEKLRHHDSRCLKAELSARRVQLPTA